jgi:hypothetical protein
MDIEHSYICHWLYDYSGTELVRAIGTLIDHWTESAVPLASFKRRTTQWESK